jgi:hypothetical protein
MKSDPNRETDTALNKILKEWRVEAQLPPRFQDQVWRRIERAETQAARVSFRSLLTRWLEALVPKPRLAYSYAAILLAVGVAAGAWAGQAQSSRLAASLGSRYLQSINPYQAAADVK